MRSVAWWHFQWPWRTPNPVFKVTVYLKSISQGYSLRDKVSIEHLYEIIRNLSNGITFNDLEWPLTRISRSRHFLQSNIGKMVRLKDKVTIAQEVTMPNISNGTMFCDRDWPLNASPGFVRLTLCYV